jgi:hypothetical protein
MTASVTNLTPASECNPASGGRTFDAFVGTSKEKAGARFRRVGGAVKLAVGPLYCTSRMQLTHSLKPPGSNP